MIESMNTNELIGQCELDDMLPKDGDTAHDAMDGYDADGNLLNIDYPPLQKPSPMGKVPPEGADEVAATAPLASVQDEAPDAPHTSAETRLSVLATEINAITEQTRGVVISAALAVGKRLIEAKSLCPAGRFGEWLEKSVSYSERKAQDMMRLYVEYGRDGAIPESIAALDYSKAVALLSAPAEARQQLAERTAEEDLSVRQLNAEIAKLKAEKLKAQMTIEDMEFRLNSAKEAIAIRDDNEQKYDRAIVERDQKLKANAVEIEAAKEDLRVAQAKATAAEAAADELRKLRAEAEERADKNDQRARDAVSRANRTAVDLSEARARIAQLEAEAAQKPSPSGASSAREDVQWTSDSETGPAGPWTGGPRSGSEEVVSQERVVEVIPDSVQQELADLRRQLAEAQAAQKAPSQRELAPKATEGVSAAEKFKWFYANQMKSAFNTALSLLTEVAKEDPEAARLFATALVKGCQQLMNQLGTKEG